MDTYSFTIYNIYKDFIICGSEGKEIKEHENNLIHQYIFQV